MQKQPKLFRRSMFCLMIVWSALGFALEAPAPEPQTVVLALYGSRPDLPANVLVDEIIRSTLEKKLGSRLDFYAEFMDGTRWPEKETHLAMRDFLRKRYAHKKISVIIAVARPAINFMRLYGDELFPGIPIVAYGDLDALRDWSPARPIAARLGKLDISGTAELILRLQPHTREILVISGVSSSDQWLQSITRQQLAVLGNRVKITYVGDTTVEDLEKTVAGVPDGTVIQFVAMTQDSAGNRLLSSEVLSRLARKARVPIYSQGGSYVGLGTVGGVVFNPESLGRETAQLTSRVLEGERVQDLSIRESKSTVPMVDWRQLRRWRISEKRLPAGTIVRFREPTIWESYKWYIIGLVAAITLEAFLIVTLLIEGRRRRLSEKALKHLSGRLIHAAEEERQRLARELHDDIGQRLALLSVGLDILRQESSVDAKVVDQRLQEEMQQVSELATDIHNLSHRLHSSKLRHLGLKVALKEICEQVSRQHHIDIQLQADDFASPLSEDLSICFYRVAQEALSNVVKHSHSDRVELGLGNGRGRVWMRIKDFGVGFDPAVHANGIGLAAMQERLWMVGGSLHIKSSPGSGTELTAEVKAENPAAAVDAA